MKLEEIKFSEDELQLLEELTNRITEIALGKTKSFQDLTTRIEKMLEEREPDYVDDSLGLVGGHRSEALRALEQLETDLLKVDQMDVYAEDEKLCLQRAWFCSITIRKEVEEMIGQIKRMLEHRREMEVGDISG